VWRGFEEQTAALLLSLFALTQIPMRIGAAHLADRWSMTRVPALAALAGVGAVLVLLIPVQGSIVLGVLFALLFALGETGNSSGWAVIGDFFGRLRYGSIRGSVSMVQSLISIPAPVIAGFIYDKTESYQLALIPVACFYFLSFLLYWALRRPRARAPLPPTYAEVG
jgi:nitrate/nitrite transporter NarK